MPKVSRAAFALGGLGGDGEALTDRLPKRRAAVRAAERLICSGSATGNASGGTRSVAGAEVEESQPSISALAALLPSAKVRTTASSKQPLASSKTLVTRCGSRYQATVRTDWPCPSSLPDRWTSCKEWPAPSHRCLSSGCVCTSSR